MKSILLGVIVLAALLTACGGSSSATSTVAAAPATATSSTAAAPPTATSTATAGAPAPTATSSPAPVSPTTPATVASQTEAASPAAVVNDPDLARLLLAVTDLPAGWVATPLTDESDDDFVCNAPSIQSQFGDIPQAEADFQQSDNGPFVVQQVGRYDSAATATQVLQYMQQSASCGTWTSSDGAQNSITAQPAPSLGDASLAYVFTVTTSQYTLRIEVVVVRKGAVVLQLLQESISTVDSALTQTLAQQAAAKLP